MRLRARLIGLLLVFAGFASMGVIYVIWLLEASIAPRIPLPPGISPDLVPIASPLGCILPFAAAGAALLVLEGIRRTIAGD